MSPMVSRFLLLMIVANVLLGVGAMAGCKQRPHDGSGANVESENHGVEASGDLIHVYEGQSIQAALDEAASKGVRDVVVHPGIYCPPEPRQALIWFNRRHDGIHLQGRGDVKLTAANASLSDPTRPSHPAVVNHIVYFGDGITNKTRISGFEITGANNFVTTKNRPVIQPEVQQARLAKTAFSYTDGGAVKIFGRSYPVLERLLVVDNYASASSGGISIEHRGYIQEGRVQIRDCVFRNNRAPLTGAALSLLDHQYGSNAYIENCLFVANLSNCMLDHRSQQLGTWQKHAGHGAATVFAYSKAEFVRCTFVGNRNGVDDLSQGSKYRDCIFWKNDAAGGWPKGARYDLNVADAAGVQNCFLSMNNLGVNPRENMLDATDPELDARFVPRSDVYASAGYRPLITETPGNKSLKNMRGAKAGRTAQLDRADNVEPLEELQIKVEGQGFSWNIEYPTGVVVRRHMYVPAGRPIRMQIGSGDFLYQFSLPKQSVKQVAIPGMIHSAVFTAADPGVYPLVGDQFCGYTHPDLIGKLIVKSPEEFRVWLTKQRLRQDEVR